MNTAILFLIFNRPDLSTQVFARIREARPERLFVAADGARPEHAGEADVCAAARGVVDLVDWPCEVKTLFREKNLGCRRAISEAITWFFEHVDEGLILEDDCLPDPSFFRYCEELLALHRDDRRVMAVCGNNFQPPEFDTGASYYFSVYPHCWGWATWRRAWALYDIEMSEWPDLSRTGWLRGLMQRPEIADYDRERFDFVHQKRMDTWDYQWTYSCMLNSGLSIHPCTNLVTNIGFDERSTHTASMAFLKVPENAISFPLRHPKHVTRCFEADLYSAYHVFRVSHFPRLRRIKNALIQKMTLVRYLAGRVPVRIWEKVESRKSIGEKQKLGKSKVEIKTGSSGDDDG